MGTERPICKAEQSVTKLREAKAMSAAERTKPRIVTCLNLMSERVSDAQASRHAQLVRWRVSRLAQARRKNSDELHLNIVPCG